LIASATAEDHPAGIDHIQAQFTGLAFEKGLQIHDLDAAQPALQKLRKRKCHAPIVHRDHYFVDVQAAA
jgi:hypothetical protein